MKPIHLLAACALAVGLALGSHAAADEEKPDYAEFSKLIHQAVTAQMPKQYEDRSSWGKTIPIPDKLRLIGLTVQADATVNVALDCDVAITLNTNKFPPELQIEPKVVDCQLDLKEFELIRVGKLIEGKDARELGNELKDILKQLIRLYEP